MRISKVAQVLKGSTRTVLTHVDVDEIADDMRKDQERNLIPSNAHIVKRSRSYTKQLPVLLNRLESSREFILEDIFPKASSVLNGFDDANEVLTSALGETASLAPMKRILESYVLDAVRSKLMFHVLDNFNMSDAEKQVFLLRVLTSEGHSNDRVQALLHEVQSLVDLQRTRKGSELQLQQLQETKRGGGRRRSQPDNAVPWSDRRGQPVSDEEIQRRLLASRKPRQTRRESK